MEEKRSIDELNRSNWNTWKVQMKHLLLAKGLWGLVDGSAVLADDATAAVQDLFRSRLQKAFSTIILAIDSALNRSRHGCVKKTFLMGDTREQTFFKEAVFSFRDERRYIGGTTFEAHKKSPINLQPLGRPFPKRIKL